MAPPVADSTQPPRSHPIHNLIVLALAGAALIAILGFALWFSLLPQAAAVPNRNQNELAVEVAAPVDLSFQRAPTTAKTPVVPAATRAQRRQARLAGHTGEMDTASASIGSGLIAEARRYLGTNPTGRAHDWCGAFLDMVLRRTGRSGGGNLARGYLNYGPHLAAPEVGAIVVFSRAGGGHVGIVTGFDSNGNPIVISGNHNHRVAEAVYPRQRAIAYVMPRG